MVHRICPTTANRHPCAVYIFITESQVQNEDCMTSRDETLEDALDEKDDCRLFRRLNSMMC